MMILCFMVVFLVPCALASACWKKDSCHYPDTNPLGVPFLDISTTDIFPMSCVRVCSLTDGCVSVTLDPVKAVCHLYGETASFGLTKVVGKSLWLFQAAGTPCIRVRYEWQCTALLKRYACSCVLFCYVVVVSSILLTTYEPLTRRVKFRVAHAPRMPGTFSPPPRVSDPDMHHGTCVTHVPWCMAGSLTIGLLWSRGRENVPAFPAHAQPTILRIW